VCLLGVTQQCYQSHMPHRSCCFSQRHYVDGRVRGVQLAWDDSTVLQQPVAARVPNTAEHPSQLITTTHTGNSTQTSTNLATLIETCMSNTSWKPTILS
jgi:hypothetical protein